MQQSGRAQASGAGSSLLPALRRATADLHARTEQHPLVGALLSPALQTEQLAWLLCGFREFYALLEPKLSAGLPSSLLDRGYCYQPRLPLLTADIADLVDKPPAVSGLCRDIPLPALNNPLGILYVVEGATQGGRVIAPALRASLALGPARGARYFHLFQRGQWQIVRQWLATTGIDGRQDVLASGCDTFTLLHRVLDRVQMMRQGHGHD